MSIIFDSQRKFPKIRTFLLGAGFLLGLAATAQAAFVHPGTLSTKGELDFVRTRYLAGKQPWKSIIDSYKKSANLNFQPANLTHIATESGGSRDATTWYNNVQASYLHAMLFAVTGDEAYAKVAARIINKWASNNPTFGGNDAKLDKGWAGPMVFAAEILKHVWKKWSPAEIAQFEKFLRERINIGLPIDGHNNWASTALATKLAIGVFLDDKAIFDAGVAAYKAFMPGYVGTDGLNYTRREDYMHHARMGIGGTYMAAEIGWHQGVNLWESSGDLRLLWSAEKGVTRLDGHPHRSVTKNVEGQTPNWACWELAYNHFHHRLGKPMPEVQIFLSKLRPDKGMFGVPMLSPTHADVGNGDGKATTGIKALEAWFGLPREFAPELYDMQGRRFPEARPSQRVRQAVVKGTMARKPAGAQ